MRPSDTNTSEPWRVGVLFSSSGYMALIEETQIRGTLVAIEEINARGGINGRELLPVIYDAQSENSMFRMWAKQMLTEDGIQTIFGCYTSSSRKAVLPIVERMNGLLWYPTLYEGFEYSPNVIYTGAAPNQNSMTLCDFLIEEYGQRFFFVGSDYIYPRESNRIMRGLLQRRGGEVVGEHYVSMRAQRHDFLPVMQSINSLKPDAIFSTVVGSGTIYMYQVYNDFGFNPKIMPIASLTTTEAEIRAMGYDVGFQHVTAATYFQSIAAESNEHFINLYKKRFGDDEPTNMCVEAAYFQVHMFARALEKTNSLDTDQLRSMVLGSTFDAPQGQVMLDPLCSHANLWSRIGLARRDGQFEVIRESKTAIPADPFLQCAVPVSR